ncbi:MAG: hypothetical protein J6W00_01890 [Lentisphaeria bacterium]|nr:hypothetical protein [Lentisphaeria bacterium]
MNMRLILFALFAVSGLCSCATYVTGSDGNRYEALSKREINHLVTVSRNSLRDNLKKRLITRKEYFDAMRSEPSVKIEYRGDKYGTATVIWRTSDRKLEFKYHDYLTADVITRCTFSTSYISDADRGIQPDFSLKGR